jgi:hypothetical protein
MNTKNTDQTPQTTIDLDPLDSEAQAELAKYLDEPLDTLAEGIRASSKEIAQSKGKIAAVRDHARESAIAAGFQILAAKQQMPRGDFGPWVKKCHISSDTAERYMALAAKSAHVRKLPAGTTLRQAYIAVGIIKLPVPDPVSDLCRQIKRIRIEIRALPKKLEMAERTTLAKALRSLQADCDNVAQKLETSKRVRLRLLPKACPSSRQIELSPDQVDNLIAVELAGVFRAS